MIAKMLWTLSCYKWMVKVWDNLLGTCRAKCGKIGKEAGAVTWVCGKLDYYLVGRHFESEKDHKPLVSVLVEKKLSCLPIIWVQKFRLKITRYDHDIFHTNVGKVSSVKIACCYNVEAFIYSVIASSDYLDSKEEQIMVAISVIHE